jgi:hypothetical protein
MADRRGSVLRAYFYSNLVATLIAVVQEAWKEGKIKKSRGALFVDIIKTYCSKHGIELPFQQTQGLQILSPAGKQDG